MTTLDAIERKLAVLQVLVGVNLALTIGVLWLNCLIIGRLPQ